MHLVECEISLECVLQGAASSNSNCLFTISFCNEESLREQS